MRIIIHYLCAHVLLVKQTLPCSCYRNTPDLVLLADQGHLPLVWWCLFNMRQIAHSVQIV